MGIRFAKSIKLGDLFKVNISKTGISATIGKKGASINVGNKGTYLNLSPSIAGISGTGVSYRKKITSGYGSLLNNLTGNNNTNSSKENIKVTLDDSVIKDYEESLYNSINIHKLSDSVLNSEGFDKKISSESNSDIKDIYTKCKNGDEDTIESLVGSFFANFDFVYPVTASYELEDSVLYIDLDLPEIEDFVEQYPTIVKDKIVNKNKTKKQLKQEYAYTVMSLSIYIAAQTFNISTSIKEVIISGFTSLRDSNGDLKDSYLYSIKYSRNVFENTNFEDIDNAYEFINKFENRINLNTDTFTFKSIKPYEMPSVEKNNELIFDAVSALKELGYKNTVINKILPSLNELKLNSSGEYLKEALKLISGEK